MVNIDTRLPLMVQQPNILAALEGGTRAAAGANNFLRQVEGQNLFRQHGAGAMQGQQNALAAIAGYDPTMALNMQTTQNENRRADERLSMDRERLQMARDQVARGLAEAENQAEAAREAREAVRLGNQAFSAWQAGDEARWRQITGLIGMDLPMSEEGVAALGAVVQGASAYEAWRGAQPSGVEPTAEMRNLEWRAKQAGLQPGTPEYQEFMRTGGRSEVPLVANYIGDQGSAPAPGPVFPTQGGDVPAGSGRGAFGASGFLGNLANRATDFAFGTEVAPVIGDNVRFFRALEEDGLVNLSQAYGRQPAQQLMERLRRLLPNVGTVEGAQAAYRELQIMRDRFANDKAVAERRLNGRSRMTPSEETEVTRQILALEALIAQMDEGIRRLDPNAGSGAADVSPDDVQLMEQLLNDG